MSEIPLTPKQYDMIFNLRDISEVFYGGSAGGGKSEGLLAFCLHRRIACPGSVGLALRRTFPELEKSLIRKSYKFFDQVAKYNESKKTWYFHNGSIQEFGYCQNERDVYQYQCFHPDTEVLSLSGWKNIKDISVGELTATMNPETREMEYQPVSKTWAYKFDGNLEYVKDKQGVAYAVTPNHTIWASTQRVNTLKPYRADELPLVAKIPQTAKWSGIIPDNVVNFISDGNNGRKISFDASTWVEFLGWYLAEGNCWIPRHEIKVTQVNKCGREKIKRVLSKIKGINFHETDTAFTFNNKALCSYLSQFGLSGDKYIPHDVKQFSPEYLDVLLKALIDGDGTWYTKTQGVFVSSSKRLADDVCEIAVKAGYKVTVDFRNDNPDDSPYGTKPRWRVYVLKKDGDTVISRARGKMSYFGPVHCVTVPPHHTVLIRYEGRVSWSGQSAEYDDIEFDELTHFTKYQYLYMLSRLRSSQGNWKTLVRSASNPGNIGHKWVKDRFVIPAKNKIHEITDEEGNVRTLYFLPATLGDNTLMNEEKQREYRAWLNTLPETEKRQLKEGVWEEIPMEGAYYMAELALALKQGRITRVPYVQSLPVDTYWDLGIDDSTTIWFVQALHSGEVRIIDYYEQSGEGLAHYAKILRDKPYVYRNHFMPHDVEVRELGTGISRKDTALGLGIKPIETVKRARDNEAVMAGIEAARNILTRCWFDSDNTAQGVEALKNYRKEWDEANQIFKTKPLHDWSSHAADAFRTFSMGFKDFTRAKKPVKRPVCTLAA